MSDDIEGSAGQSGEGRGVVWLSGMPAAGSAGGCMVDGVRRYWSALRGERIVPLRSDVDPRGIEGALDGAFILERIAPGIAKFRLAGSQLIEVVGAEVRGMPLSVMFTPGARRQLGEAVEAVFAGPEVVHLSLMGERSFGRPTLSGQMILLPLKSDLGDISRALGCLATDGSIGRTPRRFAIRGVERTNLLLDRPVPPPAQPHATSGRGHAPMPGSAVQRMRQVPGAPHLRVVETTE